MKSDTAFMPSCHLYCTLLSNPNPQLDWGIFFQLQFFFLHFFSKGKKKKKESWFYSSFKYYLKKLNNIFFFFFFFPLFQVCAFLIIIFFFFEYITFLIIMVICTIKIIYNNGDRMFVLIKHILWRENTIFTVKKYDNYRIKC